MLYDYSISPNGYKREIHRDSDARTFVFLLYLNNLSKSGEGGELEIYKYKKDKDKMHQDQDLRIAKWLKVFHQNQDVSHFFKFI